MRKLRLKLDTVAVESFQTATAPVGTGTVAGQEATNGPACLPTRTCPTQYLSCPVENTDPASCQYGCGCTDAHSLC